MPALLAVSLITLFLGGSLLATRQLEGAIGRSDAVLAGRVAATATSPAGYNAATRANGIH
ncbi:MAG: hypothetical protein CL406_06630 [Acidimicrobiaceae bacterium]|nr:hypothetical protein [Acidimicrobiaceae bacterium]MDP6480449.1 hypothetical protein [Acidimicrobiales bacterium]